MGYRTCERYTQEEDMELMGTFEVARLARVSPQAVANWIQRKRDFPRPVAELASGPVWNGVDIRRWLAKNTIASQTRRALGGGFAQGTTYTLAEIVGALGGETQSYLPQKEGKIVCGRFTPEMNRRLPYEVLVGDLPRVRRKAESIAIQKGPIPIFVKESPNHWRYHGQMLCSGFCVDSNLVRELEASSGRSGLAGVLHFVDVDVR